MTNYGDIALSAVNIYRIKNDSPRNAWEKATFQIYTKGSSGQKKGCPRDAFLGLCEEGLVVGIKKGDYTESKKNKEYALKAAELLISKKASQEKTTVLWLEIQCDHPKSQNGQMDVVLALWTNNLIVKK